MSYFRRTFAGAAALAFIAEAVAHVLILIHRNFRLQYDPTFRLSHIPFWADVFMLLVGGYGALGLWIFFHDLRVRRCRTCFWYGFITLFLTITIGLHAYILIRHSHDILKMFSYQYSFLGLAYCIAFAVTLLLMRLLPTEDEL